MNKEYKIKLDLNKKLYNKKMAFNQFDENVNDFYIEVTKNNEVVKDLDKSIITLVAIKPNNAVDAQFIEVKEGQIYADLKPSMCDLVGNYQAKAMIVLEGEIVTTDTINYSVSEDKIISRLNDDVVSDERFPLFTDALARLSTIEITEEQRMINEAERILSEENRKIEEAKRVEAELVRQHEEADRSKYDAIRESNENIRKQNESIRLANETNRIDEEAKRVEEENKRKLAEEERNANYNFMTEDEERRRSEANAHKEAEVLRVQAETNRVNEEAKRRTTEQARVSAENTRVNNENTREANEEARQTNETKRVEAEIQRQSRYNSFIADAEANANNFENYTNTAKVKEEERKANELDRKSQEDRRVSNEVERISNENTRKANEVVREKNETSRQNIFENKVDEVDEKIVELNTTKDNFVSSINTKVDTKISEIDKSKTDMTNTVSNKINEVENRFNALTSKQQQDAEVIDARDGETSLKARLDRDIEKAKQVYVNVEGSHISTDSSSGYAKDVEILGNTIQDASNLADIRSVGDTVEGQELYEIPVVSVGKNLFDNENMLVNKSIDDNGNEVDANNTNTSKYIKIKSNTDYVTSVISWGRLSFYDENKKFLFNSKGSEANNIYVNSQTAKYVRVSFNTSSTNIQLEEGTVATPYEPYQEDKLTILSPVQLEKVGDVADRIIEKDGVWGVEKNVTHLNLFDISWLLKETLTNTLRFGISSHTDIFVTSSPCITNIVPYNNTNDSDTPHIRIDGTKPNGALRLWVNKSDLATQDVNGLIAYLNQKNAYLKYILATPTFIPLPHDQQIKLRTFANKTNISFGCEIEGTIKAQVPKSLGATVNTHTEQINNLNKELDRVKKLEESTVSTVTTESDFTTVEATSGGYFEDVKLEGKTLVNLVEYIPFSYSAKFPNIQFKKWQMLKPSTEYTFVLLGDFTNARDVFIGDSTATEVILPRGNYGQVFTFTTPSNINEFTKAMSIYVYKNNVDLTETQVAGWKLLILEGDHTQNTPSYFEGLKSVGQSATTSEDGIDEIVVESVNENLWDDVLLSEGADRAVNKNPIKFHSGYTYTLSFRGLSTLLGSSSIQIFLMEHRGYPYPVNGNSEGVVQVIGDWNNKDSYTFTVPRSGMFYIQTRGSQEVMKSFTDISLSVGVTGTHTPHQSDKKRLLYYNEETQAWEKPILRQWDSIEKHADGKYYYHQRSGETSVTDSNLGVYREDDVYICFACPGVGGLTVHSSNIICNMINTIKNPLITNEECIYCLANDYIYIKILKSRLSTQDVAGFKQWLQANNVTIVYQLAQEKVYECTNIDLITYANETNYVVESGVLSPRTTLKVHNNISNVVSLLQKKVSLLESNITSYMITQNRLMLASRYNADTVSFKVDVATLRNSFEYDNDLYELILNNVLVGKDNYNREYIENLIIFYWMDFILSDEMYSTLFEIIEEQHNPKIIEEEAPLV